MDSEDPGFFGKTATLWHSNLLVAFTQRLPRTLSCSDSSSPCPVSYLAPGHDLTVAPVHPVRPSVIHTIDDDSTFPFLPCPLHYRADPVYCSIPWRRPQSFHPTRTSTPSCPSASLYLSFFVHSATLRSRRRPGCIYSALLLAQRTRLNTVRYTTDTLPSQCRRQAARLLSPFSPCRRCISARSPPFQLP